MRARPQLVQKNVEASPVESLGQNSAELLDQSSSSETKVDELQADPLNLMRHQVGLETLRLRAGTGSRRVLQKQSTLPRIAFLVSITIAFIP